MSPKKAADRDLRDHIKDTVSLASALITGKLVVENIALHINTDAGIGPCPGAKGTERRSKNRWNSFYLYSEKLL